MQYKKHLCTALISSTLLASTACTTGPVVLGVTGTDNIEGQNLEPGADNAPLLNNRPNPPEAPRGNWFTRNCCCFRFFNRHRSPSPPPVSQIDLIPSHDEAPTRSLVLLLSVTGDNRREPSTTIRQTVSLLDSPRPTNCWQHVSSPPKDYRAHSYESKTPRSRSGAYSYENKMLRSGRSTQYSRRDEYSRESMYEIYTGEKLRRGTVKKAFDLYEEKMEEEEATKIEKEFLRLLDPEISLDSLYLITRDHMCDFINKVEDGTINTDKLARIFTWIKRLRVDKRTMIMYELLSALEAQKEGVQDRWYNRYIPFGMLFSCSKDPWERIRWAKSELDKGNFNETILGRPLYDSVLSCTAPLLKRLGKFNWQQQEAIIDKTLSQGAKMGLMPSSEYYNARAFLLIDRRLNKKDYTSIVKRIIGKLGDLSRAPKFVREHRLDRTLLTENKYLGLRAHFADPLSTYDYMEGIGEMESDSELTEPATREHKHRD